MSQEGQPNPVQNVALVEKTEELAQTVIELPAPEEGQQ